MITDIVRALVENGASPQMILAAVEAAEARASNRREKDAERKRQQRAREKAEKESEMSRGRRVTARDIRDNADSSLSQDSIPPPPKGGCPPRGNNTEIRAELLKTLDAEHADAVIEHRRKTRAALSARSARLLAGKFAQCRDPNAAADAMVVNGWRGFEPEWLENRKQGPPVHGHSKPLTGSQEMLLALDKFRNRNTAPPPGNGADFGSGTTIETSFFRRSG